MALKILILTPRIPYPMRDGGAIAMNQTLEAYLEQGAEVSLLSMNTSRHWVEEHTLPALYKKLSHFDSVFVNTTINPLSAFFNLFTDKSYNVSRFVNKEFENALIEMLRLDNFDVIQFESIYTSPYLKIARKFSTAKCVCRVHNIEHLLWRRLAQNEGSFLKKTYLGLLTNRLRNFEMEILQKFDLLLPISSNEEKFLQANQFNHCYYLPFGVEEKKELPELNQEELSCFHIGSMDWAPNVEGVQWFLEEVWTKIQHSLPDVSLYLAGKNMPASFLSKEGANLHIVGEVEDVTLFCLQKNIMLVPLLSAAGIRIKILEAMAIGKTIISTNIGADGIGATHMEEIILANTPDEFLSSLQFCFANKEASDRIGRNAQAFVLSKYRKQFIYQNLIQRIKQLL